jgi:hypothetical protein
MQGEPKPKMKLFETHEFLDHLSIKYTIYPTKWCVAILKNNFER